MIVAVSFGLAEMRRTRRQRQRDATYTMMRSLQTREMLEGLLLLYGLPRGLGKDALEAQVGAGMVPILTLLATWESLGILVFQREIPLGQVDDFYSGPIAASWDKLGHYVEDHRARSGRQTDWEWFQWLAERMAERERTAPPAGAYTLHRNWKPSRKTD